MTSLGAYCRLPCSVWWLPFDDVACHTVSWGLRCCAYMFMYIYMYTIYSSVPCNLGMCMKPNGWTHNGRFLRSVCTSLFMCYWYQFCGWSLLFGWIPGRLLFGSAGSDVYVIMEQVFLDVPLGVLFILAFWFSGLTSYSSSMGCISDLMLEYLLDFIRFLRLFLIWCPSTS